MAPFVVLAIHYIDYMNVTICFHLFLSLSQVTDTNESPSSTKTPTPTPRTKVHPQLTVARLHACAFVSHQCSKSLCCETQCFCL